jgi:hypothetical protein
LSFSSPTPSLPGLVKVDGDSLFGSREKPAKLKQTFKKNIIFWVVMPCSSQRVVFWRNIPPPPRVKE